MCIKYTWRADGAHLKNMTHLINIKLVLYIIFAIKLRLFCKKFDRQ